MHSSSHGEHARPRSAAPAIAGFVEWSDRHFKWLLVAPAVAPDPGAVDLSAAVLDLGRLRQLRFPGSRPRLCRPEELSSRWCSIRSPAGRCRDRHAVGRATSPSNSCSAWRWRSRWSRRFRGRGVIMSILIMPLFISPVIVGQAWALLLQRPFGPTNYLLGQLLGREVTISWLTQSPWNFICPHPRRRLAMDALHVRHPARRADRDPAASLRGGRARRRRAPGRPSGRSPCRSSRR